MTLPSSLKDKKYQDSFVQLLIYSGAPAREARAGEAPWISKSTHPRKLGNHVTIHRTNDCPSAPQAYQ